MATNNQTNPKTTAEKIKAGIAAGWEKNANTNKLAYKANLTDTTKTDYLSKNIKGKITFAGVKKDNVKKTGGAVKTKKKK